MSRRIIILSVDRNPTYAWFVPLCSLMWRDVAGFEVSCIYVGGDVDPWLLEKACDAGVLIHQSPAPACCSVPAASQIVRLFSYALPGITPDDYLLSVDADAWPLADAFDPAGGGIDLIYPDACDRAETPYFPIGYIGATAKVWRGIMGIDAATPGTGLEELFASDPLLVGGHGGWNYDETMITRKIKASGERLHIARRAGDPPVDRIDRSAWPKYPRRAGMMDAHLIRPGWTEENWPRLRPLLAECLTPINLEWADDYRAGYLARSDLK